MKQAQRRKYHHQLPSMKQFWKTKPSQQFHNPFPQKKPHRPLPLTDGKSPTSSSLAWEVSKVHGEKVDEQHLHNSLPCKLSSNILVCLPANFPAYLQPDQPLHLHIYTSTDYHLESESPSNSLQTILQEPLFTPLDKTYLSSLPNFKFVNDPEAFTKITEGSLVYAIHCYAQVYKKIAEGVRPAVLVGTDVGNFGRFNL